MFKKEKKATVCLQLYDIFFLKKTGLADIEIFRIFGDFAPDSGPILVDFGSQLGSQSPFKIEPK